MPLQFAFLVLEEHPWGRQMLRILLDNGFVPGIVIQEVSRVGDEERDKFLKRIEGQPVPPRLNQLVTGRNIPVYCVGNHNDATCAELVNAVQPDVVVLGGTRIIKPHVLEIPKRATVNCHPGLLPWLRGSASVGWALYKDLPQGATAHFIDPGIDTGDIIIRRQLPVHRADTYESLCSRVGPIRFERDSAGECRSRGSANVMQRREQTLFQAPKFCQGLGLGCRLDFQQLPREAH